MDNTTVVSAKSGLIKAEGKLVIQDFADVMAGFRPGKKIESEAFMLGDTPVTIAVYPNGEVDEYKGHVSIFLYNNGDDDINVKCQLITDVEKREFGYDVPLTAKGGGNPGRGYSKFLSHAACAEAYKDKDFVVTAKLETDGDEVVKIFGRQSDAASAPKKRKFNVWENVHDKMVRADFTLVFEGEEVPCHKHVLAAASPVLEAMVENKHREAVDSKADINLSAEVGRVFVRFIYTGEVQEDIMKEHASAFLELGEMYDLQELKDMAEMELLSQLEKENMVEMISIGEIFRAEDIFEAALKMTKINMTWLRNQVYSTVWKFSNRLT